MHLLSDWQAINVLDSGYTFVSSIPRTKAGGGEQMVDCGWLAGALPLNTDPPP